MKVLCTAQMGSTTVMGQTARVVAIARALRRRGHEVKFLAGGKLIPVIREHGLDLVEITDLPAFDLPAAGQWDKPPLDAEHLEKIRAAMAKTAANETAAVRRERPDLLLGGTLTSVQVAADLGLPSILVFLQPHGRRTLELFSRRLGGQDDLREKMAAGLKAVDAIILEGMPELSGGVGLDEIAPGLADKIHFSGPLLTEYPDELPDRAALRQKHAAGADPFIYITIGGGSALIGDEFLRLVLETLRRLPRITGLIATGLAIDPAAIAAAEPPANAIIRGFVPGTELIKASDLTVFHGGSSTLMTCLACGTPAVVIPSMGEQEDNGAVIADNGAGIVLAKATLDPGQLAEAIEKILAAPAYRRQAERLKALGEKYGGAEGAATLAEKIAAPAAARR